jgi:hypothetical protein
MSNLSQQSPLDSEPYSSFVKRMIDAGEKNSTIAGVLFEKYQLDTSRDSVRRFRKRHQTEQAPAGKAFVPEVAGIRITEDEAVIIEPVTMRPKLGDIGKLIRERGLDPADWVVVSTTLNEWDGMTGKQRDNELVRLKQWKVTLRRAPHLILASPAVSVPRLKIVPIKHHAQKPETIVVEGDHQAPYHDPHLHEASLRLLQKLSKSHNLTEHIFLGDTGDFPTISRHADHPGASAGVNDVIQSCYEILSDKREAAPNARARKLKGNHDWRVESELLLRAERMYGIKPADTLSGPELPALSLRRLLHLDALEIELVEDLRGWEHGEIEVVQGMAGLVVRHGWLTGANTAKRSLEKRGRSLIVGHTHTREHFYIWDPSAGIERQAAVAGTMSLTRDHRFPHYAVCDNWLPGLVVVSRWPDGAFSIEHACWDGTYLTWRNQRFV